MLNKVVVSRVTAELFFIRPEPDLSEPEPGAERVSVRGSTDQQHYVDRKRFTAAD